jgi:quercetin dioxygenase-like cupin family protein
VTTKPPEAIDFERLPWQSTLPGARHKVYREGAKQIRLIEFTAEFVEPHWCENGHLGFVLEGTLQIDFHGRLVVYECGAGIFIPAGAATGHKARALTPTVRLILVEDDAQPA